MRFLLHHTDATYDAATKTYWFTLDQRISNPTRLTLRKASYTGATASAYPHAVYLRSNALSSMILEKHTVELKESHAQSNVVGVLHETHTRGRYRTIEQDTWRTAKHLHNTRIDVQFTDGATVLTGAQAASSASSGGAADDQSMIDIGDLLILWIDMDYSPLDSMSQPVTTVGNNVLYLRNRFPGTAQLFFTGTADDFVLADVGETKGVVGGPNVSWASMVDGNGVDMSAPCSFHMVVRVPPVSGVQSIVSLPGEMFKFSFNANTLQFKTGNGTQVINNVTFLPSEFWYIECRLHDDDGDNVANFSWRFINLADPTVEITEQTQGHILSVNWTQNWNISNASDHFTCTLGPMAFMEAGNSAKRDVIRDWMLSKYSSASVSEESEPAADAAFQIELEIETS